MRDRPELFRGGYREGNCAVKPARDRNKPRRGCCKAARGVAFGRTMISCPDHWISSNLLLAAIKLDPCCISCNDNGCSAGEPSTPVGLAEMLGPACRCSHQVVAASSSLVAWETAILGAILCAALGAVLSWLYTRRQRREDFLRLLRQVAQELSAIQTGCTDRSATAGEAVTIDPPLPTEAWRMLNSSGQLETLAEGHLRSLRTVYTAVVAANHVAGQWCCLLQIARLSNDGETRQTFDELAARARVEPLEDVESQLPAAVADLDDEIDLRSKQLRKRIGRKKEQ